MLAHAENFDAVVTEMMYESVKLKARTCKFRVVQDSIIRDQTVSEINYKKSERERL